MSQKKLNELTYFPALLEKVLLQSNVVSLFSILAMCNSPQEQGDIDAVDAVPAIEADVHPPSLISRPLHLANNLQASSNSADSAYEESLNESQYSTSLASSVMNYKYENGRRYHSYREGSYPLPNDESEQERLDLLHHIFKLMLDGELFRAPIPPDPHRVLDFGTGTGIWAMDFADQFPSAEVVGTDLSPIQPMWVQPNCRFYVDDVESEWVYRESEAFDFIHGRGMAGSIRDWPKLYEQIYKNLKPGGYLEMQEYETWVRSDDGTLENAKFIIEWQEKIDEASKAFGKQMNVAGLQKGYIQDAGFEDVTEDIYKVSLLISDNPESLLTSNQLPQGPWPKDKKQKLIGRYQIAQMLAAVEPFTLAVFTRSLGWSNQEAQALMAGDRADFRNPKNHLYVIVRFIYGRKPLDK